MLDYAGMYRRAGQLFADLKSETRPRDLIKQMSGGQRQAVAIARTMLADAKIVLMDEPTAAISVRQVAEVLNHIRHLRDQGIAVVLISHRMPDVFDVADRIIVLRRGRKVADKRSPSDLARGGDRADHRRDRDGLRRTKPMAVTLDQAIAQKEHTLARAAVLNSQAFWVLLAIIAACVFLSFATDAFLTSKNLYNITRNATFVAIIALGMTLVIITGGIDLCVGSVLCLCCMVLAVTMHAGYGHLGRHRRLGGDGAGRRRVQRRAGRLFRLSALRRDARHAVDRAQPGDGRCRTTPWSSSSARTTTSCWRSAAARPSASPTRCSTWWCWRC